MSTGLSTAHSVVEPTPLVRRIAGVFVIAYALITLIPLVWIGLTSIKSPPDSIAYPPKVLPFVDFDPTIEGYCNLFTTRSRQTAEYLATLPPPSGACEAQARSRSMVVAGPSNLRAALPEFRGDRLWLDLLRDAAGHAGGLCVLALQGAAEG